MSGIFMHRFFITIPLIKEVTISSGELYHQLTHVFRVKMGEEIILFSEWTDDMVYSVNTITKKSLSLLLKRKIPNIFIQPKRWLSLFQAYPNKLSTLEILIQKCSELWVEQIVLFDAEHCQMHEVSPAKKIRLESISREALEQCWGNISLQLVYLSYGVAELLLKYPGYTHIVGNLSWEKLTSQDTYQWLPRALWIGPEGGWSAFEQDFFEKNSMTLWKFNNRILRLETAAIVGAGILLS